MNTKRVTKPKLSFSHILPYNNLSVDLMTFSFFMVVLPNDIELEEGIIKLYLG